jgi:hypothetical protein
MGFCQQCRFFLKLSIEYGSCRRYPPQVIAKHEKDFEKPAIRYQSFDFPVVRISDWCGEFQKKSEED